jgi:hypothetical protein
MSVLSGLDLFVIDSQWFTIGEHAEYDVFRGKYM